MYARMSRLLKRQDLLEMSTSLSVIEDLNPGRWSRWNCVCYDKNAVRFDDYGRITSGEIAL